MEAKGLTPILDVTDIASTFAWFEKRGWKDSGSGERLPCLARLDRVKDSFELGEEPRDLLSLALLYDAPRATGSPGMEIHNLAWCKSHRMKREQSEDEVPSIQTRSLL